MKNLRGRPRNISESGIVYLDSDGEDSEYSDSDVEPVFFPAAEFELGDALEEFAGDVDDEEENDNNANRGRFFQLIHALDSDEDSSSDDEAPPAVQVGGQELHRSVIQYFGGTVEVRHIVHENFAQLQQQQQQAHNSTAQQGPSSHLPLLASAGTNTDPVQVIPISSSSTGEGPESSSVRRQGEDSGESSEGEPPSICESGILISVQVEGNSSGITAIRMTDQSNEVICLNVGEGAPEQKEIDINTDSSSKSAEVVESLPAEETVADLSIGSSGLVPYPDLPDYASAGEDDDDDFLGASIPAPYKSKSLSPKPSSSCGVRLSLKRKEPDAEEDDGYKDVDSPEKSSRKRVTENAGKLSDEDDDAEEETCNPMVSDEEGSETEEVFRGDRIGNTVYSERHVLKILMKWIEELPKYSIENLLKARENEEPEDEIEKRIQRLNTDLEEQMSLLWDMSSEKDVMNFLVENKIFSFIRDTIDRSACNRLTEIALGILANVISEPGIIEDFTVHDSSMHLVEKVVELCTKVSDVAVLIQVFSVLRRIVWYLKNVASVKKWTDLLQSTNFLGCANFIMSSSRNVLLLGNVIMLFFTLLDFLNPEIDDDAEDLVGDGRLDYEKSVEAQPESSSSLSRERLAKNYAPFCNSEFVPSICEALKELMKNPKPPNTQRQLTSTREKQPGPSVGGGGQTDDHCPNADDIDIPIPEGHVQQAILKGFSTLALLQKASNGQNALRESATRVIGVLLEFYLIFTTCTEAVTRSNSLEYFALSLHLLSFCHNSLESVNPDAITTPISTASKLMSQEERDKEVDMVIRVQLKDGVEFDSVSYIALVAHEYLASVAEKFGPDSTLQARSSAINDKFFAVLDKVLARFDKENDKDTPPSNNGFENNPVSS